MFCKDSWNNEWGNRCVVFLSSVLSNGTNGVKDIWFVLHLNHLVWDSRQGFCLVRFGKKIVKPCGMYSKCPLSMFRVVQFPCLEFYFVFNLGCSTSASKGLINGWLTPIFLTFCLLVSIPWAQQCYQRTSLVVLSMWSSTLKFGWRKVKTCRFGSRNWFWLCKIAHFRGGLWKVQQCYTPPGKKV